MISRTGLRIQRNLPVHYGVVSFNEHVRLLEDFIAGGSDFVNEIERRLLNVRAKALAQQADRSALADMFNACFFESKRLPHDLSRLNGQLAAARLAEGFEAAATDGY